MNYKKKLFNIHYRYYSIRIETLIKVTDNSGIRWGKCILLKPFSKKRGTRPAGIVKISARKIKNNKKFNKGSINQGVLVRTRKNWQRDTGLSYQSNDNAIVLLDNKRLPIASRINGIIFKELKHFDLYPKIILMTRIKV